MSLPEIAGVVPILVTPFDEHDRVDRESLQRLVEFTIGAGVHGLGIALGSEVYKLTEAERDTVVKTVVDQTRGRVPIVVNISAPATRLAILGGEQAAAHGAAALMSTPPFAGCSPGEMLSYFRAIADAIPLPMMVQDTSATPVPAALLRSLAEECATVRYAKVESAPQPGQVLRAVQAAGDVMSIFGGAAGQFFLEELRRGSIGTMPWPSTPGAFVRIWDAWRAGDEASARRVYERELAPLLRISLRSIGEWHRLHKEVLRRQGIIATAHVREPADELDPFVLAELDEACRQLNIGQTA